MVYRLLNCTKLRIPMRNCYTSNVFHILTWWLYNHTYLLYLHYIPTWCRKSCFDQAKKVMQEGGIHFFGVYIHKKHTWLFTHAIIEVVNAKQERLDWIHKLARQKWRCIVWLIIPFEDWFIKLGKENQYKKDIQLMFISISVKREWNFEAIYSI